MTGLSKSGKMQRRSAGPRYGPARTLTRPGRHSSTWRQSLPSSAAIALCLLVSPGCSMLRQEPIVIERPIVPECPAPPPPTLPPAHLLDPPPDLVLHTESMPTAQGQLEACLRNYRLFSPSVERLRHLQQWIYERALGIK